jgi:hypothetical protein
MPQDERRVRIDALAEGMWRCRDYDAVVCVDVLTAGTFLVTAMAFGEGAPSPLRCDEDEIAACYDLLAIPMPKGAVYVACLRNLGATVVELDRSARRVAIVAAGHGGDARFEDEMVAAWMAGRLRAEGFVPEDRTTAVAIERWSRGSVGLIGLGRSAESLRASGRQADVDFVLSHVEDVESAARVCDGPLRVAAPRDVTRRRAS